MNHAKFSRNLNSLSFHLNHLQINSLNEISENGYSNKEKYIENKIILKKRFFLFMKNPKYLLRNFPFIYNYSVKL